MRLLIKADATKGYLPRGYVSGAAMMVKADVFRSVGLLPDAYFFYGEDKEFLLRARRFRLWRTDSQRRSRTSRKGIFLIQQE